MSRIHRRVPPKGSKIGIAFSGGLDTRCAVAWLARKGLEVHAYTADLAQPDEESPADIPPVALQHGAKAARLVDCREALVREGLIAIQCGAFHLGAAGRKYFNTTPLGRAVTTTAIVRAMREDGVHVFGDGSTHKGNDIQRFYRYGVLANPTLTIYKPWLDPAFVEAFGGRTEMSEYLNGIGLPYRMGVEKAYSTDANCSARRTRRRTSSTSTRGCASSTRSWASRSGSRRCAIEPEEVTVAFEQGLPVSLNGKRFASRFELFVGLQRHRRPPRPRHERSDREPRHRRQEPRHLRGAGHGAAAHLLRAAALGDPQREHDRPVHRARAPARPPALRGQVVRPRGDDAEGRAHPLGRAGDHRPGHARAAPRRRLHDRLDRRAAHGVRPDKLSMEKVESPFSPEDRIGALELQNLSVLDNRAFLITTSTPPARSARARAAARRRAS